jgi:DNA transformation protein and related proteins
MARQNEFVSLVLELIAPLGASSARAMFGGYGIYIDSQIIAIVVDDTLYLKADEISRKEFDQRGLEPFSYMVEGGTHHSMSYFRAPEEALDAPHAMLPWARLALAAALRKSAGKAKGNKRAAAKVSSKEGTARPKKPKPRSLAKPKR